MRCSPHCTSLLSSIVLLLHSCPSSLPFIAVGGSEGQGRGHRGANENCCYRTSNWRKLAAGALAVNDRKKIQDWLCSVLTHFVDFYIKFTLRQWMGRVKRAHIIFSHDDWGAAVGQGIGHRGQLPPPLPSRRRRPWYEYDKQSRLPHLSTEFSTSYNESTVDTVSKL